jgi:hypothetical protein
LVENYENLMCLLMLFGVWGGWILLPMIILFIVSHKLIKRVWRNPCSWIDILSFCVMVVIWYLGVQDDYNQRGIGRFLDAMVLGMIFAILLVLRFPLVWIRPHWKNICALISCIIIIVISISLTWYFDIARE